MLGVRGTSRVSLISQATWIFATLGVCGERNTHMHWHTHAYLELKCVRINMHTCALTQVPTLKIKDAHIHKSCLCTDHTSFTYIMPSVCIHKHRHRNMHAHAFILVHTTGVHDMHLQTHAHRFIWISITHAYHAHRDAGLFLCLDL